MALQRRHLLAIMVSAGAHLGLGFAFGGGAYREPAPALRADGPALVVYLHQPGRDAITASSPASPHGGQAEPVRVRPKRPPDAAPVRPVVNQPPAPRYFSLNALTQAPRVASGLIGDALLVVPGIDAQQASIEVWINDQGGVDRVAIADSDLSEETRQRLIAAFATVTFLPGKIGRITVSSQISMEILLDSEIRL